MCACTATTILPTHFEVQDHDRSTYHYIFQCFFVDRSGKQQTMNIFQPSQYRNKLIFFLENISVSSSSTQQPFVTVLEQQWMGDLLVNFNNLNHLKQQISTSMSNFPYFIQKMKRQSTMPQDVPTNTPKMWPKKSITLELEAKDLRETDTTLCPSPRSKKNIKPDDFEFIKFLGNGKFGAVYLARHIETGFIFAAKVIKKANVQAETQEETKKLINQLIRQIKIQMFLNHPNLIKLYSFFSDEYKIYLLMELAPDGQLYEYMKDSHKFSEESTSFLMRQTLLGINYMHENNVIHRDLKPENIVMVHGIPKICDFGWSVHCPKEFRNTLCGTPLYLSPEILLGDSYNEKIDSWAIGTLTYELLTGQNPFKITKKSQMTKILTQKFIMETGSACVKDFITCALQKQPQKRIATKLMLEHPFITKYAEIQTCEELCRKTIQSQKQRLKTK